MTRWTVGYYRAFNVLGDSRIIGQGSIGPIPLTEMQAYIELFEINDLDERERFIRMIKALDRVFIKHTNERLKMDRDKATRKARGHRKGKR